MCNSLDCQHNAIELEPATQPATKTPPLKAPSRAPVAKGKKRKAKAKGKARKPRQPKPIGAKAFWQAAMREHAKLGTHQTFARAIHATVLQACNQLTEPERVRLEDMRLFYGAGPDNVRGVTYYGKWQLPNGRTVDLVASCATCQESPLQMAGTIAHEMGHVLAGPGHGHTQVWRDACAKLGLIDILAAGTDYQWSNFVDGLGSQIKAIPLPRDGSPVNALVGSQLGPWGKQITAVKMRPCGAGIGRLGGKSRGAGSGSRLVLWLCKCENAPKVRASNGSGLNATCNVCKSKLEPDDDSQPPAHGMGPNGKGAPVAAMRRAGVLPPKGKRVRKSTRSSKARAKRHMYAPEVA